MPWPIRDLLTMKQEAVEFALQEGANRRALARRYDISVPCLYKWMKRYSQRGLDGLHEDSRRPIRSPNRTGVALESLV